MTSTRSLMLALAGLALIAAPAAAENDVADVASLQTTFETAVEALNGGNLDGFLDTVHEEALSFYACGPTSGKQGRGGLRDRLEPVLQQHHRGGIPDE